MDPVNSSIKRLSIEQLSTPPEEKGVPSNTQVVDVAEPFLPESTLSTDPVASKVSSPLLSFNVEQVTERELKSAIGNSNVEDEERMPDGYQTKRGDDALVQKKRGGGGAAKTSDVRRFLESNIKSLLTIDLSSPMSNEEIDNVIKRIERLLKSEPSLSVDQHMNLICLDRSKGLGYLGNEPSGGWCCSQSSGGLGTSPFLMSVVAFGGGRAAVALIERLGADPFTKDPYDRSLLHLLVAKGHKSNFYLAHTTIGYDDQYKLFSMILDSRHSGFSISKHINTQDIYGLTPLHYACARQDRKYIQPLVDAGADPRIKDVNSNDCFAVLFLAEQERLNIIALAVTAEVTRFYGKKLMQDYKLDGDKDYYFSKQDQLNSDGYPVSLFSHQLFGLASELEEQLPEGVDDLKNLLASKKTGLGLDGDRLSLRMWEV